jgi:hypothetical protein
MHMNLTIIIWYFQDLNKMGTTSDKAVLTRKLGAADYDPVRYVAEISQRCVGMLVFSVECK